MENMSILFSDSPCDFSDWTTEKCGRVLMDLCIVMRDCPEIVSNDFFLDALDNALKLFGLCHGNLNGIRCDLVYTMLLRFNVEGYYFLEDLLYNTKLGNIMKHILQTERDEEILKLIEANDKRNRTILAELLAKANHSNKWVAQIAYDIEYVHDGSKTWDWVYQKHCNDRHTFTPQFNDDLIRQVYDYFNSDAYKNADNINMEIN